MKKYLIAITLVFLSYTSYSQSNQKLSDAALLYNTLTDIYHNVDDVDNGYFEKIGYSSRVKTYHIDTCIYCFLSDSKNKGYLVYTKYITLPSGKGIPNNLAVAYTTNKIKEFNNLLEYIKTKGFNKVDAEDGKVVEIYQVVNTPLGIPNVSANTIARSENDKSDVYELDGVKLKFVKFNGDNDNQLFKYEVVFSLTK
jgi:hypothetical protein